MDASYATKIFSPDFHYSKSVNHENSKCLDFASVQVKPILQKGHFFSHSKQHEN